MKYRIPVHDIFRISLSPFTDDIVVIHVQTVSLILFPFSLSFSCSKEVSFSYHAVYMYLVAQWSLSTNYTNVYLLLPQIPRYILLPSNPIRSFPSFSLSLNLFLYFSPNIFSLSSTFSLPTEYTRGYFLLSFPWFSSILIHSVLSEAFSRIYLFSLLPFFTFLFFHSKPV